MKHFELLYRVPNSHLPYVNVELVGFSAPSIDFDHV